MHGKQMIPENKGLHNEECCAALQAANIEGMENLYD